MTLLEVLNEVAKQYEVEDYTVISCLKRAVRDELGLGEVLEDYRDGKLNLFEIFIDQHGKEKTRRVTLTQKRLNGVRDRLYACIIEENTKARLEAIKKSLPRDRIVRGKMVSNKAWGWQVATRYGKAFAPARLLNPKEVQEGKYKAGAEVDFHVYKLGIKKNRMNMVLDRVSQSLTRHIIKEVLGEGYIIYSLQRRFGKHLKLYINKEPSQDEKTLLSMTFNEKIKFKLI